jgi:hypothetical protein
MKELPTWAERSTFTYSGSVKEGTRLFVGKSKQELFIDKKSYAMLLEEFNERTVSVGTSRTNPPKHSLGEWLNQHVTKVAVASYVSRILIHEGFGEKVDRSLIKIRK